ncbi:hypothetical protein BAUCODRAFT_118417 [Baudoinia panamericana UAMH 10762]|uniref:Uncharacterized protein n=1 Tax=Baudoinia panamericana (strain UAMH 10762) TaxID=717646 RepID=M2MUQ4_BAUPA|nr:uncharacterized protein BAUCODRAFT_118417 [Baudoinia panamericana UAMH 10762]EMD00667.1 hypothetical protein BAUCODRAFT_118417 [Baudoinia panamericana UAMH 10762]
MRGPASHQTSLPATVCVLVSFYCLLALHPLGYKPGPSTGQEDGSKPMERIFDARLAVCSSML